MRRIKKYQDEGRCKRCGVKLNPEMDGNSLYCLNCNDPLYDRHGNRGKIIHATN